MPMLISSGSKTCATIQNITMFKDFGKAVILKYTKVHPHFLLTFALHSYNYAEWSIERTNFSVSNKIFLILMTRTIA